MKTFAVPPRIPSSPPSSPFVKQSSLWPRIQEFLQEVKKFDSQPLKQPTNVNIRGFHPNTTCAVIQQCEFRFGEIETEKSTIGHLTNTCKGYEFIKYHNFVDVEDCIRSFYCRDYEAKFAKLGQNSLLKTLGSLDNTNLDVSKLPRKMNDAELAELFYYVNPDFEVLLQKILRDSQRISWGVGFARFKTPPIGEFSKPMNEYNRVVYGPGSPLASISMSSSRSYLANQLPSKSPNSHSFYSSPKSSRVMATRTHLIIFEVKTSLQDTELHSLGKASPIDQNGASWMTIKTPEQKKSFSMNIGRNLPNPSAPIGHSDDVFSHWFQFQT